MRLINADKLQAKHFLQRSEYPTGYEGTQAVYDYTDVLAYDIESAETVEAIPVEWIKRYVRKMCADDGGRYSSKAYGIDRMTYDWEKENEQR